MYTKYLQIYDYLYMSCYFRFICLLDYIQLKFVYVVS